VQTKENLTAARKLIRWKTVQWIRRLNSDVCTMHHKSARYELSSDQWLHQGEELERKDW